MRRSTSENGQVLPLMLVLLLVAVVGALALARLAGVATERAAARTAADAAALAGAAAGRPAAEAAASANGARLTQYRERGAVVEVVVRRSTVEAAARAERVSVRSTRVGGAPAPTLAGHVGGSAPGR